MTQEKQNAVNAIEEKAGLIGDVADHIWEYAELSLQEVKSAALYCEVLEKEGFQVEKGISGIETAFSAKEAASNLLSLYYIVSLLSIQELNS